MKNDKNNFNLNSSLKDNYIIAWDIILDGQAFRFKIFSSSLHRIINEVRILSI